MVYGWIKEWIWEMINNGMIVIYWREMNNDIKWKGYIFENIFEIKVLKL